MPITVTCQCGRQLRAKDEHTGMQVTCPVCGRAVVIPDVMHAAISPPMGSGSASSRPPGMPPAPRTAALNADESSGWGRTVVAVLVLLTAMLFLGAVGFVGHREGWWKTLLAHETQKKYKPALPPPVQPSAPGFNANNFEATKAWIERKVQQLVRLQGQGNDFAYKESLETVEKELQAVIGGQVIWELHVERVGSGGVHFQEEGDVQQDLMAAFNGESPTRIEFTGAPNIPPEQLRQLRAGNVVPITGTVVGVNTSNFPGRLAIRLDVNANAPSSIGQIDAKETTISELVDAFDRNPIAADAKYGHRLLKITGVFGGLTLFGAGALGKSQNKVFQLKEGGIVFADAATPNKIAWLRFRPCPQELRGLGPQLDGIRATLVAGDCEIYSGSRSYVLLTCKSILPSLDEFVSVVDSEKRAREKRREAERQAKEAEINRRIARGQVDAVIKPPLSNDDRRALRLDMIVEASGPLIGLQEKENVTLELRVGMRRGETVWEAWTAAIFDAKYKPQIVTLTKGQTIAVRGRVMHDRDCDLDRCILATGDVVSANSRTAETDKKSPSRSTEKASKATTAKELDDREIPKQPKNPTLPEKGPRGGNALTDASVLKGLEWLARNQKQDGSWSLSGPYSASVPKSFDNEVAATAMALLAFQGAGNTHMEGKFKNNVARGWKWLLKQQDAEGCFFHSGGFNHRFYTQGQCGIAICELYEMSKDTRCLEPAQRAIDYCLQSQSHEGGWRYIPNADSDVSVTGWVVMALQSARIAGLKVPSENLRRIQQFLDNVAQHNGARYPYQKGLDARRSTTAEALLMRQWLGWNRDDPRLVSGMDWITSPENLIDFKNDRDVYYWHYATQAARQIGGNHWRRWNAVMRQVVPEHQVAHGKESGSWDPNQPSPDQWANHGGRLYVTCLSLRMLELAR